MLCVVAPLLRGRHSRDGVIKMSACVDAMIPEITDRDFFPENKESQIWKLF
ncbi:MAG: hypothetical protein QNJ58_27440 [Desulfobacterales bacterium]|nr:hypothetical protein [Desulfobacterales bacterium]